MHIYENVCKEQKVNLVLMLLYFLKNVELIYRKYV